MNVGMVGLGEMGAGIMERLLLAGHKPLGYNRTRAKAQPLIDKGMRFADSPRAVAEGSDIVLTMVTDDDALEAIAGGPDGILAGLTAGQDLGRDQHGRARHDSRARRTRRATGAQLLDAAVLGQPAHDPPGKAADMCRRRRRDLRARASRCCSTSGRPCAASARSVTPR